MVPFETDILIRHWDSAEQKRVELGAVIGKWEIHLPASLLDPIQPPRRRRLRDRHRPKSVRR